MSVTWSHSKLSCLLNCPMTYYLNYRLGIHPAAEKQAFAVGSAVHWGLEHDTDDLTEYFGKKAINYTYDQALSEAMAYGYKVNKERIFEEVLDDGEGGKLKLLDEQHEVWIIGHLKSFKYQEPNLFVGIIDLLLLVEDKHGQKFFIVIDYKTSSMIPNWSDYLEQIYRYIFLLRSEFPKIPVKKIGIINLRKIKERQRSCETMVEFARRLRTDYELNDMDNINVHMYNRADLDDRLVDSYIDNLSRQVDFAKGVDDNNLFYINYGALVGKYGRSDFFEILMQTPGAHIFYKINDHVLLDGEYVTDRPCFESDMLVVTEQDKVICKYERFKELAASFIEENDREVTWDDFEKFLQLIGMIISPKLFDIYVDTFVKDKDVPDSLKVSKI